MKILQVLTGELGYDGISTVVRNIAEHMVKVGHTVDIIAQNKVDYPVAEKFITIGCDIKVLKGRLKNPAKYYFDLKKTVRENKYDIIHIHCNSATVAMEIRAIKKNSDSKIVIHSHNTTCKYKIVDRLLRRYMYKNADQFLACATEAGKWLFEDKEFIVINNGIDVQKYAFDETRRQQVRDQLCISKNEMLIGHIGKFNQQKNHKYLIEIFNNLLKRNKNYKLLLVGSGELVNSIRERVENLKISDKVIFLGEIDNVCDVLNAMDIIVFPSIYEGLPLTILEAQANGLPCFISDNISKEVAVTDLVSFCALEDMDNWCEKIVNVERVSHRDEYSVIIKEKSLELDQTMKKLEKVYVNIYKP